MDRGWCEMGGEIRSEILPMMVLEESVLDLNWDFVMSCWKIWLFENCSFETHIFV